LLKIDDEEVRKYKGSDPELLKDALTQKDLGNE
jgi:hypothetical protein